MAPQLALYWQTDLMDWLARRGTSNISLKSYANDLGRFTEWFQAENNCEFRPGLLTSIDLRAYRQHSLTVERVMPATWNHRRATLANLVSWAKATGQVQGDPLAGVDPAAEERPIRWMATAEYRSLLRTLEIAVNGATTDAWRTQALRDQAMVLLMAHAGLRVGELVAMDVDDVQISERKGAVTVRLGKREKYRVVPLSAEARLALSAWIRTAGLASGMPLFGGKGSGRLSSRQVQRRVAELRRLAGVEHLTPHQLRHTFAKRVVATSPVTVAQKLMGHARISTTARYIEPGWEDLEKAIETI